MLSKFFLKTAEQNLIIVYCSRIFKLKRGRRNIFFYLYFIFSRNKTIQKIPTVFFQNHSTSENPLAQPLCFLLHFNPK